MERRNEIFKTIVIIWIVAATGYVVFDLWSDYKVKGIQAAYQTGKNETIQQLIDEVKKNGCQPLGITKDQQTLQVINADCLGQPALTPSDSSSTRGGQDSAPAQSPAK
jgi:hypothetical protein